MVRTVYSIHPQNYLLSNQCKKQNKFMRNCLHILVIGIKRQHFFTTKLKLYI